MGRRRDLKDEGNDGLATLIDYFRNQPPKGFWGRVEVRFKEGVKDGYFTEKFIEVECL